MRVLVFDDAAAIGRLVVANTYLIGRMVAVEAVQ
jgi:hypothetical protein